MNQSGPAVHGDSGPIKRNMFVPLFAVRNLFSDISDVLGTPVTTKYQNYNSKPPMEELTPVQIAQRDAERKRKQEEQQKKIESAKKKQAFAKRQRRYGMGPYAITGIAVGSFLVFLLLAALAIYAYVKLYGIGLTW